MLRSFHSIFYSPYKRQQKIVALLVRNNAPIDATTLDNSTALHLAAHAHNGEIAKILIQSGANKELQDAAGNSFLAYAHERLRNWHKHMLSQHAKNVEKNKQDWRIVNNRVDNSFFKAANYTIKIYLAAYKKFVHAWPSNFAITHWQREQSLSA